MRRRGAWIVVSLAAAGLLGLAAFGSLRPEGREGRRGSRGPVSAADAGSSGTTSRPPLARPRPVEGSRDFEIVDARTGERVRSPRLRLFTLHPLDEVPVGDPGASLPPGFVRVPLADETRGLRVLIGAEGYESVVLKMAELDRLEPIVRLNPAGKEGVRFRVLDASTGRPVPRPRLLSAPDSVDLREAMRSTGSLETVSAGGEDGTLEVPPAPRLRTCLLVAPDFVPRVLLLPDGAGRLPDALLAPAGVLASLTVGVEEGARPPVSVTVERLGPGWGEPAIGEFLDEKTIDALRDFPTQFSRTTTGFQAGSLAFDALAPGNYLVRSDFGGGAWDRVELILPAGALERVVLRSRPAGATLRFVGDALPDGAVIVVGEGQSRGEELAGVPPGRAAVRVRLRNGLELPRAEVVEIPEIGMIEVRIPPIPELFTIEGRMLLLTPDGRTEPLAGVTFASRDGLRFRTDETGAYAVEQVPAFRHTLFVQGEFDPGVVKWQVDAKGPPRQRMGDFTFRPRPS